MLKPLTTEDLARSGNVNSCRICALMFSNLKLWTDIHEKVLMSDESVQGTSKWLNNQLKELGDENKISPDEAKPIHYNIAREHFNKHVVTVEIFQRLLKSAIRFQTNNASEDTLIFHQDLRERFGLTHDVVDEFIQLRELVKSAEDRICQMDARLKTQESKPGYMVDFGQICTYQKLVTENLKNRKELISMQNSIEVAGKAVETAIVMVAKAVMNEAAQVAEEAAAHVSREHPGSLAVEEVNNLIRSRLGDGLKSIIQDAHLVVLRQYGIK